MCTSVKSVAARRRVPECPPLDSPATSEARSKARTTMSALRDLHQLRLFLRRQYELIKMNMRVVGNGDALHSVHRRHVHEPLPFSGDKVHEIRLTLEFELHSSPSVPQSFSLS